jgi:hypothetical protein
METTPRDTTLKIYKITDNTNDNVYIGSTKSKYLSVRLAMHRIHYRRYLKNKSNFVTSFNIIKNENYKIDLVEVVPDKANLKIRERFHIENTPNCINKNIPSRTNKEFLRTQYNKPDSNYRKYKTNYYLANKSNINFHSRQNRINIKFNNLIKKLENLI